ncbi:MAG TPA: undecaprenyl-phosphate glucose phosphotransferase [Anaerolineae bacterium]|nr:undecaprenyl-phosphate glucose phosphotransferase [Anaerolineae bacterium]
MSKRHKELLTLGLVLLDAFLINVAFAVAYWLRYEVQWIRPLEEQNYIPFRAYVPMALVLTVIMLVAYKLERVYDQRRGASWLDEVYAIFSGTLIGMAGLTVFTFYYRPTFYSRLMLGYVFVLIVVILSLSRLVERVILDRLRRRGIGVDRVLIVGAGEVGRAIMRNIVAQPQLGYQIIGFVDDDPVKQRTDIGRFKALGGTENLPRLLQEQAVDEVIITLPWTSHRKVIRLMGHCERQGVRAKIVPDLFQMSLNRVDVDDINGIPLIGVKEVTIRGWNLAIKRAMDVVIASVGLVLCAPLMGLIALLIKADSPGPVLFRQVRVGRGGRLFTLYKFRSMRQEAEAERAQLLDLNEATGPIFKIRDDPRLTRVGKLLRRTSLDELPQLYNVLRGEMSLVGPRPPIPSEVEQYQEWHRRRLEVSPGVTGLWQVSGRSDLTFDEMVMLDLFYAENWSLWLDLKILLRTIPTIILGTGAY